MVEDEFPTESCIYGMPCIWYTQATETLKGHDNFIFPKKFSRHDKILCRHDEIKSSWWDKIRHDEILCRLDDIISRQDDLVSRHDDFYLVKMT